MRRTRRDHTAQLEAELRDARPYLDLAKEIRAEVARVAANGGSAETLAEAVESIPARERVAVARAVFERLSADEQWTVIERVFGDDEIRTALEDDRARRLEQLRKASVHEALRSTARAERRLDTRRALAGERLVLGMFRQPDVAAAVVRGHTSTSAARRLVLLGDGPPGTFRVIEDAFNPAGGYFVSREYDEEKWRSNDRLPGHALVRVGSLQPTTDSGTFEPVLYIGGRVDFEVDGEPRPGLLHLGYVMIGEDDIFSERGDTP